MGCVGFVDCIEVASRCLSGLGWRASWTSRVSVVGTLRGLCGLGVLHFLVLRAQHRFGGVLKIANRRGRNHRCEGLHVYSVCGVGWLLHQDWK
mgnify:CR=1 FL=1